MINRLKESYRDARDLFGFPLGLIIFILSPLFMPILWLQDWKIRHEYKTSVCIAAGFVEMVWIWTVVLSIGYLIL